MHVTGLEISSCKSSDDVRYTIGTNVHEHEVGTWNIVDGVPGLVTLSGEFWLGMLCRFWDVKMITNPKRLRTQFRQLLRRDGARACFVPCAEPGVEFRYPYDVADRMADSYAGLMCMHGKWVRECPGCSVEDCGKHTW